MQKGFLKILSAIFILIILFSAFLRVSKDWDSVNWNEYHFDFKYLLVAIFFALLANLQIVFIYQSILSVFNITIPFKTGFRIQLLSQVGKYIPGKVGLLFTKVLECSKIGIPKKISLISGSYEIVLGIFFLMLAGGLMMPFLIAEIGYDKNVVPIHWLLFLLPICLLCIHPKVFISFINIYFKLAGEKVISLKISSTQWGVFSLQFLGLTFINGMVAYFVVNTIVPVPFEKIFFFMGASSWAFLLGLINVFAPSGIGVREGVLIALYAYIIPAPIALGIVILNRILVTIVEWVLIGSAFFIKPQQLNEG